MSDAESDPAPASPEISKEELRLAMKAFRKRLKLTQLDEESRLGYGPMSSGNQYNIAAIRPPDTYPKAVWKALAEQGKLRHDGGGLYSLVQRQVLSKIIESITDPPARTLPRCDGFLAARTHRARTGR